MSSTDARPSAPHPPRHSRVWLDPATWRSHLRGAHEEVEVVAAWVERGRALVARRHDGSGDCCLGLALPLAHGRRRIAVAVDRAAVARVAPPLALAEVVDGSPPEWRDALGRLAAIGAFRVYGSFAWQALSGERYVTPASDIDLLFDAVEATQVAGIVASLQRWECETGRRADGEARFANGDAVAWRELATTTGRVLVKRDDGVALRPSSRFASSPFA